MSECHLLRKLTLRQTSLAHNLLDYHVQESCSWLLLRWYTHIYFRSQQVQTRCGSVVLEVSNKGQAKIAQNAGVQAIIISDLGAGTGGSILHMTGPSLIKQIKLVVSILIIARARVGHLVEAQILAEIGDVGFIDESEALAIANDKNFIDKLQFNASSSTPIQTVKL